MNESRKLARFTLKRESRKLYVFSLDDGTEVQFLDLLRGKDCEFEVVYGSSHFRLSSIGFPPSITLADQEGVILRGTNAIGSMCFSWSSDYRSYQLVGRRIAWIVWMIIGKFRAFHLRSNDRRIAYWAWRRRKSGDEIRGVYWDDLPATEIASVVFGSMYQWDGSSF